MQVQAGRDRSFYKWLAKAVLTENDQRDGPLDARAAPRVFSRGIARWINQRRLAHVCSKEMQLLMPVAPQDFLQAETSFPQGGKTRSKCEAASSTSARLSRNPTWQMLAEARFIVDICVEGSRIPAVQVLPDTCRTRHFQEATKLPVSDTLLRL